MKTICFLFFVFCFLFLGCKKKEEVKIEEQPITPPAPVEVPRPEYETYQYLDMGRRDPFVPLKGVEVVVSEVGKGEKKITIEETEKKEEELTGWSICGFVWDKNERMAVIKNKEESYFFAFGTLSDKNGEVVSDIKVKAKDDGIILVKNKKEIFLKMEEKEKHVKEENVIE